MFFHLLYISGCKVTTFYANGKDEVGMLFHLIPYKKSNHGTAASPSNMTSTKTVQVEGRTSSNT